MCGLYGLATGFCRSQRRCPAVRFPAMANAGARKGGRFEIESGRPVIFDERNFSRCHGHACVAMLGRKACPRERGHCTHEPEN